MASTVGSTPSVLTRSKADLPHPNSKKAPKTFTGHHDEIESFLREFEEMTNLYNVPTTERFDLVTCYVSRRVSEVIEGLIEYHSKHWPDVMTRSTPVLTPSLHPLGPKPIPDVSSRMRSASHRVM